ncbi:MAG: HAD family phosphatase [Dehalococcoidia bacterium]|nr:HAD family phosphatase [Dehalococcoidia bacterium]MCA9829323.1 HAD family phosphatase [Dehalococcoidia bacterium]MCB9485303.1 HAD family phosphatase [Thermoflexaceae bacterium]
MDGVLVDGEPLHFRAVNQLLADEGRAITLDQYRPYMGTKAGWAEFVTDFGLQHSREHYAPRYNELILEQYRSELEPLPGAVEAVRTLQQARVPLALASSSARPWVDACLMSIGLAGAFPVTVTGSDIVNGKPDPEIYLAAAAALDIPSERCLAVEDAPAGIASAIAAGMTCWAVRTEYTLGLDLGHPTRVFNSLTEAPFHEIAGAAA